MNTGAHFSAIAKPRQYTHHIPVGLIVEGLGKNGYNKDVDEERDEERDGRLNEVILVGFLYFLLISTVNITRLHGGNK